LDLSRISGLIQNGSHVKQLCILFWLIQKVGSGYHQPVVTNIPVGHLVPGFTADTKEEAETGVIENIELAVAGIGGFVADVALPSKHHGSL
jgi:hypothetical protein